MLSPSPATSETDDPFVRFSLALIGVASRLLPDAERRAWRSEWNAEILTRREEWLAAGRFDGAARVRLVTHAWGSFRDALYVSTHGFGLSNLLHDLRRAGRSLSKRPGFTVTAVVTLMLGIGANTALFSVVRGVLLRPFPYEEPERLVQLVGHRIGDDEGRNVSYPNLADIERDVSSLSAVAGMTGWQPALTDGTPEVVPGATVSWDYFDVLGVRPTAGRFFTADEEGEGRAPTVVISHGLWVRRFAADPEVVGSTISINNAAYLLVGVAPARFEGPHLITFNGEQPEVWRTPWFEAADWFRSGRSWKGIARLADGFDQAAGQTEVTTVMTRLAEAFPEENANRTMTLAPLRDSVVGETRTALYVLLGAVGLVLLVACVNVANLLTGRMLERQDELQVRSTLGASGGRLLTHLFAESVAIAILGGGLGVLVAYAGVYGIVSTAGPWLPRPEAIVVDGAVLAFSALLSSGTALAFGLLPALRIVRGARPASVSGTRTLGAAGSRTTSIRRTLVLAQIATTVVLVVGAGLLLQSFWNLHGVDLGVERDGVLTMDLHGAAWWDLEAEAAGARYRDILDRITALPGVQAAGAMDVLPLADNYSCDGFTPTDRPPPAPGEGACAEVRSVTPGALAALGVRPLRGRSIDWSDDADAARGAVITARTAEMFWPGQDALGKRAVIHSDTFSIVGVVGDIRHFGPEDVVSPMAFLPAAQEPWNGIARGLSLVVRGDRVVESMADELRAVVHSVDPTIAVSEARPMRTLLAGTVGGPRLRATLLVVFACLALVLALVGIAGVMSQAVARRRRELGLRMALGAAPHSATALVLRDAVQLTALGLVLGLLASTVVTRFLTAFVFGVSPLEPRILLVGGALVAALSLLSSWIPARRASRIDPMEALRADQM